MKQGKVVRITYGKNFGFISDGLERDDYFFHRDDFHGFWKDLESDFANGKEIPVQFDEATPREKYKGRRATNVSRLDYPNQSTTEISSTNVNHRSIETVTDDD